MTSKLALTRGRLTLELDATQVFYDDPGQGTPALVRAGNACATYWCAIDTGELDGGRTTMRLTSSELEWLGSMEPVVEAFLYGSDDDEEE